MDAASQLLDLELEVEAVAPQQLAVLPGQLVVGVGGRDLLALHAVHRLQHLEADLVHQRLGVLGEQHDLLQVQGVAQAPHRLPRLDGAVADAELAHLVHDGLALQPVNLLTLLDAELADAVGVGVALLQLAGSCAQLVQPGAQLLEAGVQEVAGQVEVLASPLLGGLLPRRGLIVAEDFCLSSERGDGGVSILVDGEDGLTSGRRGRGHVGRQRRRGEG